MTRAIFVSLCCLLASPISARSPFDQCLQSHFSPMLDEAPRLISLVGEYPRSNWPPKDFFGWREEDDGWAFSSVGRPLLLEQGRLYSEIRAQTLGEHDSDIEISTTSIWWENRRFELQKWVLFGGGSDTRHGIIVLDHSLETWSLPVWSFGMESAISLTLLQGRTLEVNVLGHSGRPPNYLFRLDRDQGLTPLAKADSSFVDLDQKIRQIVASTTSGSKFPDDHSHSDKVIRQLGCWTPIHWRSTQRGPEVTHDVVYGPFDDPSIPDPGPPFRARVISRVEGDTWRAIKLVRPGVKEAKPADESSTGTTGNQKSSFLIPGKK